MFDTEDGKHATVVVPDDKLSLAIGRRVERSFGPFLTGFRIDIKSASEYEAFEAEQYATATLRRSQEVAQE